jgi:hypothetical protein
MLKLRALVVITLGFAAGSLVKSQQAVTPALSKAPLTADQVAVYRTFLQSYNNGSDATLNLANKTEPLNLPDMGKDPECLKGIKLENVQEAASTVHMLDVSLAVKGRVVLVDPKRQSNRIKSNDPGKTMREGKSADDAVANAFASGLLTVSEIAFDKDHHWAVLNFSFKCGMLCGHGATLVLEKTGEEWKLTKRRCIEWIS